MDENYLDKIFDLSFHGLDYIFRFYSDADQLKIELELKQTGEIWKNTFTSSQIEEHTEKIGNPKKFPIFIKMLLTALSRSSDSVMIEVLSYHDLELLRSKNGQTESRLRDQSVGFQKTIKNNKRYLIMTYLVEFDKVHYPLPLNFDENPSVETLKNTIQRFRLEVEELKGQCMMNQSQLGGQELQMSMGGNQGGIVQLRNENEILKNKIRRLEEKLGATEFDQTIKKKFELESDLSALKAEHIKETNNYQNKISELQQALDQKINELHEFQNNLPNLSNDSIKKQLVKANEVSDQSLNIVKQKLEQSEKQNEILMSELESYKILEKKNKVRIKQLEMDLESALKRATHKEVTGRLYGNSRNNSPHRSRDNSPMNSTKKNSFSKRSSPAHSRQLSITSTPASQGKVFSRRNSPAAKTPAPQQRNTPSRNTPSKSNYIKPSPSKPRNFQKSQNNNTGIRKNSPFQQRNTPTQSSQKVKQSPALKVRQQINNSPYRANGNNQQQRSGTKQSAKKQFQRKTIIPKAQPSEDNHLIKKLEDLKSRNKENIENNQCQESSDIDDRLNKLQTLLKMSKN